jgi:hypothetical protein
VADLPGSVSTLAACRIAVANALKDVDNGREPEAEGYLKIAADRVRLGFYSRTQLVASVYEDAVAGPLAIVGLPTITVDNMGFGPMTVPILVMVRKDKKESWDGLDIDDLAAAILSRLNTSIYYAGEAKAVEPSSLTSHTPDYITDTCPGLVILSFSVSIPEPQ